MGQINGLQEQPGQGRGRVLSEGLSPAWPLPRGVHKGLAESKGWAWLTQVTVPWTATAC